MDLGELPAHHRRPVLAVRGREPGQRARQPAAGLEVDLGAGIGGQLAEAPGALARAPGREPLEAEPVGGQPGHGQRGGHRGRSRQRRHPDARRRGRRDQAVAGIADPRGARVGDQQDVLARLQLAQQPGGPARLHRVVVGNHAGPQLYVQAGRQPAQAPGVLGRDEPRPGELGRQPGRRVLRPADGDRGQRQYAGIVLIASRHAAQYPPVHLRAPSHLPIPLHCAAFPRRSFLALGWVRGDKHSPGSAAALWLAGESRRHRAPFDAGTRAPFDAGTVACAR